MYNGIGLPTARGSGTNGYVQANRASLFLSKVRVKYNSEADIKRAEAELNRPPNAELLEHMKKRQIELKCADFEMLMEDKGFDAADIEKKVGEYRKLLLSQVISGELDIESEMSMNDSHARAKAAIENRDRMRAALGIDEKFVDGSSFEKMNKNVGGAATVEDDFDVKKRNLDDSSKTGKKQQDKRKAENDKKSPSKKRSQRHRSETSSSSSDSSASSDSSDSDSDSSSSPSPESESDAAATSSSSSKRTSKCPHTSRKSEDVKYDDDVDKSNHLKAVKKMDKTKANKYGQNVEESCEKDIRVMKDDGDNFDKGTDKRKRSAEKDDATDGREVSKRKREYSSPTSHSRGNYHDEEGDSHHHRRIREQRYQSSPGYHRRGADRDRYGEYRGRTARDRGDDRFDRSESHNRYRSSHFSQRHQLANESGDEKDRSRRIEKGRYEHDRNHRHEREEDDSELNRGRVGEDRAHDRDCKRHDSDEEEEIRTKEQHYDNERKLRKNDDRNLQKRHRQSSEDVSCSKPKQQQKDDQQDSGDRDDDVHQKTKKSGQQSLKSYSHPAHDHRSRSKQQQSASSSSESSSSSSSSESDASSLGSDSDSGSSTSTTEKSHHTSEKGHSKNHKSCNDDGGSVNVSKLREPVCTSD